VPVLYALTFSATLLITAAVSEKVTSELHLTCAIVRNKAANPRRVRQSSSEDKPIPPESKTLKRASMSACARAGNLMRGGTVKAAPCRWGGRPWRGETQESYVPLAI
jgi:hypothetical protein